MIDIIQPRWHIFIYPAKNSYQISMNSSSVISYKRKKPDSSPAQSLGEELPGLRCKSTAFFELTNFFLKKNAILSQNWVVLTKFSPAMVCSEAEKLGIYDAVLLATLVAFY